MVTITNGTRTTKVTNGVFKEVYEPMGWKICDLSKEKIASEEIPEEVENSPEESEEIPETEVEEDESEPEEEEVEVEIPISEMKIDELKAYAAAHDIDISAAKNKQDIKDIIKAKMEG